MTQLFRLHLAQLLSTITSEPNRDFLESFLLTKFNGTMKILFLLTILNLLALVLGRTPMYGASQAKNREWVPSQKMVPRNHVPQRTPHGHGYNQRLQHHNSHPLAPQPQFHHRVRGQHTQTKHSRRGRQPHNPSYNHNPVVHQAVMNPQVQVSFRYLSVHILHNSRFKNLFHVLQPARSKGWS